MDSLRCIIFGLTPRAGLRNFVFVFPAGLPRRARQLVYDSLANIRRLLPDRIKNADDFHHVVVGDSFILTGQRVKQTTTGREGWEYLCLLSPGLTAMDDSQKKAVATWLQARFNEFQSYVQQYQWDKVTKEAVDWETLAEWQTDAQKRFFASEVIWEPPSAKQASSTRGVRRLLMATLGVAVLLVLGVLFTHALQPLPLSDLCEGLLRKLGSPQWEEPFDKLARSLGFRDRNISQEDLANLADRLEDVRSLQTPSSARYVPPETRIRDILLLIDREVNYSFTSEADVSAQDLAQYDTILQAIEKLFPNGGQFDPLGILRAERPKNDELLRWAEGIDYQQLKTMSCALATLQEIGEEEWKNMMFILEKFGPDEIPRDTVIKLDRLYTLVATSRSRDFCRRGSGNYERRFLVKADLEFLQTAQKAATLLAEIVNTGETRSWKEFREALQLDQNNVLTILDHESKNWVEKTRAEEQRLKHGWQKFGEFVRRVRELGSTGEQDGILRPIPSFSESRKSRQFE